MNEEKAKVQRFISGLPQSFKDRIEFDEPQTLEDAIRKLKHCYEQSRCKPEFKGGWRPENNRKNKERWHKRGRKMQTTGKNEGATSTNTGRLQPKFKPTEKGHVHQPIGGQNRSDDKNPLQYLTYGGNHRKVDCLQRKTSRPQIYNIQKARTVGDVAQSISRIYAVVDNR